MANSTRKLTDAVMAPSTPTVAQSRCPHCHKPALVLSRYSNTDDVMCPDCLAEGEREAVIQAQFEEVSL